MNWQAAKDFVGVRGLLPVAARRLVWHHPQWWLFAVSAFAWIAILAEASGLPVDVCRAVPIDALSRLGTFDPGVLAVAWAPEMRAWSWMLLATMLPLAAWPVRHAALRSLWTRRHRAGGGVVLGYLAAWILAGAGLSIVALGFGLKAFPSETYFAVLGLLVAAAWQWSPIKREALWACHRTAPLALQGWRADLDCVRYGWSQGCNCVVSCWALMFAMMLTGHQIVVMLVIFVICLAERAFHRPLYRQTSTALVALAAAALFLGNPT